MNFKVGKARTNEACIRRDAGNNEKFFRKVVYSYLLERMEIKKCRTGRVRLLSGIFALLNGIHIYRIFYSFFGQFLANARQIGNIEEAVYR